jgi:hypothetical protein
MFEHMTKDNVSLVKQSGEEFDNIKALVQSNLIVIEDSTLPIEEGDLLLRKLPNGLFEKYIVIDRGFIGGIGGSISAHYQVKVNKEGTIKDNERPTNVTYNLHGAQSRVNIHSQDNSTNISNETSETVFTDMRQAIQNNIHNTNEREILLAKLDELQQAKGSTSFIEKYRDFVELAEKHITIIAPFIPALSQFLS